MRRRKYSKETKAAVMAALVTGQSISQVAEEYRIPEGTVAGWSAARIQPNLTSPSSTKKEIGALVLDYLRQLLVTVRVQQQVFAEPDWLRTQDASAVGVLHGITVDKGIRLLEALSNTGEAEGDLGAAPATEEGAGD